MGLIYPQNVSWHRFFHFQEQRMSKEFQSEIFSSSKIVTLKFLIMFDFVWVELQHFTDNFVHCTSCKSIIRHATVHLPCMLSTVTSSTSLVSTETCFLSLPGATNNKPMASNFVIIFLKPCDDIESRRIYFIEWYLCHSISFFIITFNKKSTALQDWRHRQFVTVRTLLKRLTLILKIKWHEKCICIDLICFFLL